VGSFINLRRSILSEPCTGLIQSRKKRALYCHLDPSGLLICQLLRHNSSVWQTNQRPTLVTIDSIMFGFQHYGSAIFVRGIGGLTPKRHSWPPTEDQKKQGVACEPYTDSSHGFWYIDRRLLTLSLLVFLQCANIMAYFTVGLLCMFTGSIACSAKCRYLSYSEANFEVFRPAGATHCIDGVKFGIEKWTKGPLLYATPKIHSFMPNFTPSMQG